MASPRSMWTGSISMGLLNIPVTIGKATEKDRDLAISEVCEHNGKFVPIDRKHRCPECQGSPLNKIRAVMVGENQYRKVSENEWAAVENVAKGLRVEDCQPLSELPIMFATGTYYVRHDDKAKVSAKAFAALVQGLGRERLGLVCKWNQKLCVLSVERGVMLLRVIPFVADIRPASSKERAHWKEEVVERDVGKMRELLSEIRNDGGFQYAEYEDEGLRLRQSVIDRILAGEAIPEFAAPEPEADPFEMISEAVEQVKKRNARKEKATA